MDDFIKLLNVATDSKKLLANPILKDYWHTDVMTNDGDVRKDYAEYLGLRFTVKNGNSQIEGSIHKYRNKGKHNYDDFSCKDAIEVIKELCNDFEIDPYRTEVNNLEVGVNVILPFPVKLVLDNLVTYKGDCFKPEVEDGIRYYQCKKKQFYIKIYDKGLQYNLPDNVLRFEIKVIRKQYFERYKIPIYWLSDLMNPDIYPQLAELLTATFKDILFNDNRIEINGLNATERVIYYKGSNPNTWEGKSKTEREKKERQRFRAEFINLLKTHRKEEDFRGITLEKIWSKSRELSRFYRENETVFTMNDTRLKSGIVPFLYFKYNIETGHQENVSNANSISKIKKCAGCRKVLKDNQLGYCSDRCKIKKDVRNGKSNPRHGFMRKYDKFSSTPSLFEVSEMMKLSEQQKQWISKS
jgi:hypothetical protein